MRAGRPSLTARWVAAHRDRLGRTRASTPTGDVRAERALYRDVAGRGLLALPFGRPRAMADRTAFIDNEVAGAIGRGVGQIVLLGAGYDGRALRFAGATRWFEVDYPSTQDDKRRRLDALGVAPAREQVAFVGLDLMAEDLGPALDAAGHDAASPSLFVCEGLFAYLTLEVVATVCETLRTRAPGGSVLVSTYFVLPESAGAGARAHSGDTALAALRKVEGLVLSGVGEPRRSQFVAGDPEKLMVVTGWRVVRSRRTPAGRSERGAASLVLAAEPDGRGSRAA